METKQLDSEPPRRATFAQLPYLLAVFAVSVLIWTLFYFPSLSSPLSIAALFCTVVFNFVSYLSSAHQVAVVVHSTMATLACVSNPLPRTLLLSEYRALVAAMVRSRRPQVHASRNSFHWRDLTRRYANADLRLGELWRLSQADLQRFVSDYDLSPPVMYERWKARFTAERLVPLIVKGRVAAQNVYLARFAGSPVIHGSPSEAYASALAALTGAFDHPDVRDLADFTYELLRLYNDHSTFSRALTMGALLRSNVVTRLASSHGPRVREWLESLALSELPTSTREPTNPVVQAVLARHGVPFDPASLAALFEQHDLELHAGNGFDTMYDFGPFLTGLPYTPLVKGAVTVATLFLETSAFKSFSTSRGEFLKWVGEAIASARNDVSFIAKFVTYLTFLARRCKAAWETGDVFDLLGTNAFVTWTQEVMAEKDAVDAFRRFKGEYDPVAGLLRLAALRKTGDHLKDESRATDYYYVVLLATEKFVRETLNTSRDLPFGVILTGPSGIGKTQMTEVFSHLVRAKHNLPSTNLVHYHSNTKHQQVVGLPVIYVWNDAMCTKDESQETPTLEFLQALVDTAPYRVQAASLEAKEASAVEPKVVLVSTNESGYNCSRSNTGANKLDRRYLIVKFEYTPAAEKAAAKAQVELTSLISHAQTIEAGWVLWTVGYMRNDPLSNVLNFSPLVAPVQFTTLESVVGELKRRYYAHEARVEASKLALARAPCSNGITTPHDHTLCPEIQGVMSDVRGVADAGWSLAKTTLPELCSPLRRHHHYDFAVGLALLGAACFGPVGAFCLFALSRGVSMWLRKELLVLSGSEITFIGHLAFAAFLLFSGWGPLAFLVLAGASPHWWKPFVSLSAARVLAGLEMYALNAYPVRYCLVKVARWAGARVRTVPHWKELGVALALLVTVLVLLRSAISVHGAIMGLPTDEVAESFPVYATRGMGAPSFQLSKFPTPICVSVSRPGCSMRGTMLTRQLLLVPRHFLFSVKGFAVAPPGEGSEWTLHYEGTAYPQRYASGLVNSSPDADWAVVRIPNFRSCPYAEVVLAPSEPAGLLCGNSTSSLGARIPGYPYRALSSLLPLTKGDCGTPITDLEGRLVGIYTGLIGGYSLLQQVTAEILTPIEMHGLPTVRYSPVVPHVPPVAGLHPRSDAAWMLDSNPAAIPFPVLGHTPSQSKVQMTGREALGFDTFKSMLTERYVRPAAKGVPVEGDWNSLTTRKIKAASATPGTYDVSRMELVVEAYVKRFAHLPVSGVGPISIHQALTGSPENVYLAPRDSKKSSGPGLGRRGVTAQMAVVQVDPTSYTPHPALREMLEEYRAVIARDLVPMTEGRCVMKDEVIPESKFNQGGGRYFTVLDLAANLSLKMAMGSIPSVVLAHPECSFCYAGINAGSGLAWQKLWDTLSDNGNFHHVLAADHSTFDTRHGVISAAVHAVYDRLAAQFGHTPEQRHALQLHLESFFWMEVSMEGNFYVTQSMLASGRSDTIIFNSVANALIMGYAFGVEEESRAGAFPVDPFARCALATVGDDLLARCPVEWESTFPATLVAVGDLLGYKITSGVDKGELPSFIPFTEATFLKRTFVAYGKLAKAPLAYESLAKMMCYEFETKISREERLRNVALSAQREFYLHGEGPFLSFQQLLDQAEVELGITLARLTYEELDDAFKKDLLRTW